MNKKIPSIPAIGIVALCAFLVGTAVALTSLQIKNYVKNISFEPSTMQDKTANWQTYRIEDKEYIFEDKEYIFYIFEVKYPPGYGNIDEFIPPTLEDECPVDISEEECRKYDEYFISLFPEKGIIFSNGEEDIRILVLLNNNSFSVEEYMASAYGSQNLNTTLLGNLKIFYVKDESLRLAFIKRDKRDDIIIEIESSMDIDKSLYDTIISTFKFIY